MRLPPSTPRIRFRQFNHDDLDGLIALDADPDVMMFIDWQPPTRSEQRDTLTITIREYERWPNHGRYAAETLDGEFMGWFSLVVHDDPLVPELGYRLRRKFWGSGIATEGARALIDYAFESLGAMRVEAETMFVNTASRRVMEKSGMRYVRTFHVHFDDPLPGTDQGEVQYVITREEWEKRSRS